MNEYLMRLKIEKQKKEKDLRELKIKIVRLLNELCRLINPYFSKIDEIRADEIEQSADELLKTCNLAKNAEKSLKNISGDLGEND